MKKLFFKLLFLTLLASYLLYFYKAFDEHLVSRVDYINFVTAARIIKHVDAKKLYDIPLQHNIQQDLIQKYYKTEATLLFMNIPPVALLYLPVADFSMVSGYRIMLLSCFIAIFSAVYFLYKQVFRKVADFNFFALLTLFFLPLYMCFINTQLIPIVVFILVSLAYVNLIKKNYLLTGLFMGLVAVKPQYLTIVPFMFLVISNKREFIKGFLISIISILVLSVLVVGPNTFLGYFKYLIKTDNPLFAVTPKAIYSIHSVIKILPSNFLQQGLNLFIFDLVLYLFVFLLFLKKYKNIPKNIAIALIVVISIPLSIHVFIQDLILLLLPLFIFYFEYKTENRSFYIFFAFLTLYLIGIPSFYRLSAWSSVFLLIVGLLGIVKRNYSPSSISIT